MVIESASLFQAHSICSRGRRGDWRQGLTKTTLADPAHPGAAQDPVPRLIALREAIARRARDCGRTPESVKLVAVSKTFSADEIWPTIAVARSEERRVG